LKINGLMDYLGDIGRNSAKRVYSLGKSFPAKLRRT